MYAYEEVSKLRQSFKLGQYPMMLLLKVVKGVGTVAVRLTTPIGFSVDQVGY
jgi:hypothetical protein